MKKYLKLISFIATLNFLTVYSSITKAEMNFHSAKALGSTVSILKNPETGETQKISLIKLKLTKVHEQEINKRLNELKTKPYQSGELHKFKQYDLGMNNVPVLNQGSEPTCITFAVTGLLNAIHKAGDFISQQCFLQFSQTIASYQCPAAWDGSWGHCLFNQARDYGVVSKADCPTEYPNKNTLPLSYNQHYKLSKGGQWASSFSSQAISYPNDIYTVKNLLHRGKRVMIAFLIPKTKNAGDPVDGYSTGFWKLKPDARTSYDICGYNMQQCAGHAVIVTGYDENKLAFKVRNSWGTGFGVKGEYYMSYDYFRVMVQRGYIVNKFI